MSQNQKFTYVLFNTRTGVIIDELEPSSDSILSDVNATGTIELEIPFATLTSAQRKNIDNHFKAINRSVAVLIKNDLGEPFACVGGGIITSREFSVTEESAYLQAAGFSEYLNMIPTVWTTSEIKGGNVPVKSWSGRPDQLYTSILNSALGGGTGINTVTSWDTKFSSVDTRTATLSFPIDEFPTALDSMTTVRDELFDGAAPEFNIHPTLDITNNKIVWVFVNSSDVNEPQINMGTTKLLPVMPARPQVQEVTDYQITEDTSEMYNFLTIDATDTDSETVSAHIKSINTTVGSELTLFQSFDTGVPLTDSEMTEQLNTRVEGSSDPVMTTTVVLTGEQVYNLGYFTKAWKIGGTITIESGLGSRVEARAGAKATGLGTTLRLVELKFSLRDYDVNTTLSLSSISNTYPSLPEQEKKKSNDEKKKKKQRSSETKKKSIQTRIKKIKIKGKKLKLTDNKLKPNNEWESFDGDEWKPAPSDNLVGGKDEPESADPKPKKLPKGEPTDYTLGQHIPQTVNGLVMGAQTIESLINYNGKVYELSHNSKPRDKFSTYDTLTGLNTMGIRMAEVDFNIHDNKSYSDTSNKQSFPVNFLDKQGIMNLAPDRFPETFTQDIYDSVDGLDIIVGQKEYPVDWLTGVSTAGTNKRVIEADYLSVFCVNNRFYFQFVTVGYTGPKTNSSFESYQSYILSEVFFTAELNSELTSFENYELLTSPAQQLWGSNGAHKVITFSQPVNYDITRMKSDSWASNFILSNQKSQATKYFDFSDNSSEVVFFDNTFGFSGIYVGKDNNSGNIYFSVDETKRLGIEYLEMNTEFGFLEGDFTNKQPIFKESKIKSPVPKLSKYSKLGFVFSNSDIVSFTDSWVGDFSYTHKSDLFTPVYNINKYGVHLSFWSGMTEEQYYTLWEDKLLYNEFQDKFINKVFLINKNKEWQEVGIDTNYSLLNSRSVFGMILPDFTTLTAIGIEEDSDSINAWVGDGRYKIKDWGNADNKWVTGDSQTTLLGRLRRDKYLISVPMETRGSNIDNISIISTSKYGAVNASLDSPYASNNVNAQSSFLFISKSKSPYKQEVVNTPINNNMGIFKTKTDYLNGSKWNMDNSNLPIDQSLYLKLGKTPYPSVAEKDKLDDVLSNGQVPLDVSLDFSEFASYGGCNIGLDSNGDLWQWGIKLTTQIANNTTAQNTFLNNETTLNNGVNWEPVKIALPFKVKKFDFTGNPGAYGSMNKALLLLSEDGKIYRMGYISTTMVLTPTWTDVTVVNSPTSYGKFTDVKFMDKGLLAINESLNLYYTGRSPVYNSTLTTTTMESLIRPEWEGKVKSIKSMPVEGSQSVNHVRAIWTTTDGKVFAMGGKLTTGNIQGQQIPYDGKVDKAYYFNYQMILIDDKGKVKYLYNNSSTAKWDTSTFTELNTPSDFKAEELIYQLSAPGTTQFQHMIYGKLGGGLTSYGAVMSMEQMISTNKTYTPDNVGAFRSDGYIYGSDIKSKSLLPELDFLNDGEGSTGQDWGGGSWLPTNGFPVSPVPENWQTDDEGGITPDSVSEAIAKPYFINIVA